jgi:hypothetical protein
MVVLDHGVVRGRVKNAGTELCLKMVCQGPQLKIKDNSCQHLGYLKPRISIGFFPLSSILEMSRLQVHIIRFSGWKELDNMAES